MGRAAESTWREAAIGDSLFGGLWAFDHGEHEAMWAEIEGFLGPSGGALWQAKDRRGGSGGESVEAGESVGDASRAVFHVDDDEVVAGETGDLGEGRGEAEEEETVQGLAIAEARFEAFGIGGGGGSESVCVGGVYGGAIRVGGGGGFERG